MDENNDALFSLLLKATNHVSADGVKVGWLPKLYDYQQGQSSPEEEPQSLAKDSPSRSGFFHISFSIL